MRVHPIASSSAANAVLLEDGSARILLDAGVTYRALREALAFRLSTLDAVLVTHEHADHARAALELATRARVDVYATAGTWDALGGLPIGGRAHAIRPHEAFRAGPWIVHPFPTRHDARDPVGFFLSGPTSRTLYATDLAVGRFRAARLTHVLLEANHDASLVERAVAAGATDPNLAARIRHSHLSLAGALRYLELLDRSSLEEIWLLHLSDGHSDARAFRDQVERATGIPTYVAGHQGAIA